MRYRYFVSILTLAALPVLAFAQDLLPDPENMSAFVAAVAAAVKGGNWPMVAVLVLVGLVWALRKYGVKKIPFFQTEDGAVMLAALVAFAGSVTAAVVAGGPVAWGSVLVVAFVGAAKAGGSWAVVKSAVKLLLPKIAPSLSKVPFASSVVFWLVKHVFNVTVPQPEPVAVAVSSMKQASTEETATGTALEGMVYKPNNTPGE